MQMEELSTYYLVKCYDSHIETDDKKPVITNKQKYFNVLTFVVVVVLL